MLCRWTLIDANSCKRDVSHLALAVLFKYPNVDIYFIVIIGADGPDFRSVINRRRWWFMSRIQRSVANSWTRCWSSFLQRLCITGFPFLHIAHSDCLAHIPLRFDTLCGISHVVQASWCFSAAACISFCLMLLPWRVDDMDLCVVPLGFLLL